MCACDFAYTHCVSRHILVQVMHSYSRNDMSFILFRTEEVAGNCRRRLGANTSRASNFRYSESAVLFRHHFSTYGARILQPLASYSVWIFGSRLRDLSSWLFIVIGVCRAQQGEMERRRDSPHMCYVSSEVPLTCLNPQSEAPSCRRRTDILNPKQSVSIAQTSTPASPKPCLASLALLRCRPCFGATGEKGERGV